MNGIIEINNLVKKYKLYNKPTDRFKEAVHPFNKVYHKEFVALDGITLSVEKGDAVGILGKNGSGKSTLLKIITGVLSPTGGSVEINGKISAILELGAGFNPEYTGRENIYLNGLMMGYGREKMDEKIDSVIEFADIGKFIDQPVKVYSSGMFARLAFAVSINVEPDILIVDEALAVGDTRFQTKCIDKMKELKRNGTTILFVSHASEQVKRFCNKAVWIKNGKIEALGDSSEVVDLYEDYMRNDTEQLTEGTEPRANKVITSIEPDFVLPSNPDVLALITNVQINKTSLRTFEELIVEIEYEVYEESIDDLLLGAAIYTPSRDYIFGPNTFLENISIPNKMGRHKVNYCIPQLPLLGGTFCLDVGLFNNEGIINIHYMENAVSFTITNKYFSEGLVYIKHNWEVLK
ncbi:teichoic acid transport system ATP-binding protein [Paenibacillus sophorae]|uniref:ABC transporter ATP-binding protein n=1 Tax=Paenibacillus sophorae TaxID=1333845 RepID=A0A1H8HZK5_9BACL|nr:ABC transporter ATP-binding protein [Paenibacillus sophorae]QWU15813.1 ABC transporter ATP-binding protein [Paenibacillus sophorae]SEN61890.1 teichoic acid transport system ATP-binding protein [Paenibacillus sophorae]